MIDATNEDATGDAEQVQSSLADDERLKALARTGLMDMPPEEVFESAVALAASVLDAPISIFTLVDDERQAFVAATGLKDALAEDGGTPLTHSFCKHVVADDAPLRVVDARVDPRVRGNLSIRDHDVIAYLGVPVHASKGEAVGALCAISDQPRDWSDRDLERLTQVARGLESEVALREALAESEAKGTLLQRVIDTLPLGIVIAEMPSAAIAWVNRWGKDVLNDHVEADEARDYRALGAQHPDGSRYRAEEYPLVRSATHGEVIHNEPMLYHRRDGRIVALEVTSHPMEGGDGLAIATFSDVTERKAAEDKAESARRRLVRVLEGTEDPILVMDQDWTVTYANAAAQRSLPGGDDLVGKTVWKAFPGWVEGPVWHTYHDAMREGVPGKVDLQIKGTGAHYEARAFPTERDLTVFFRDVTAERAVVETRELLVRELNHRVKNVFAVVSGMIGITSRYVRTPEEMAKGLRGRIAALAKAHDLIRPAVNEDAFHQPDVSLQTLVTSLIEPHLPHTREWIGIDGPAISLSPQGTTNISLVLHEFATNAAKHGALSVPEGHLEITWRVDGRDLKLVWTERNGPVISGPPARNGFGSTLVNMSVTGSLQGSVDMDWAPEGLRATLRLPLSRLQD